MKTFEAVDTMHVVDVDRKTVSDPTYDYLLEIFITYKDIKLGEHLVSIEDAVEDINDGGFYLSGRKQRKTILLEILALHHLCKIHNAAYVRFRSH